MPLPLMCHTHDLLFDVYPWVAAGTVGALTQTSGHGLRHP